MNKIAVHGRLINIVANIENFILLIAWVISPLAWAAEIVGTSVIANAILKEYGKTTKPSTFPLKIPYWNLAFSLSIYLPIIFTIVNVSIVLFAVASSEVIVIGNDIYNIFFIILLMHSLSFNVEVITSFHISCLFLKYKIYK